MSLTYAQDEHASLMLDEQGQGYVTVAGKTTLAFWACAVCGLPSGGQERTCRHHPHAALFLRHVRER